MDHFLYVYIYCLLKAPKSFFKYQMYCNLQNKKIDMNLLIKIIYIKNIKI
jgi:hypothetical protein